MDCFSPFALRKASWQSKLITLTSEESGSASNSSTLDLFSLSLSFTDMIEATVDTLERFATQSIACQNIGALLCHMLFSPLLTDDCQHMIREN